MEEQMIELKDHGPCDGCGARVPLDQLYLCDCPELEGFICEECRRYTIVISS